MKRVLEQSNEVEYLTKLNKFNEDRSTGSKAEYTENGKNGPYYDPYDLHIHEWMFGPITEQNHGESTLRPTLLNRDNKINKYCKICHEIDYSYKLSTNFITPIHDIDRRYIINDIPVAKHILKKNVIEDKIDSKFNEVEYLTPLNKIDTKIDSKFNKVDKKFYKELFTKSLNEASNSTSSNIQIR